MINGIIGKKLGMTQVFDESGMLVPVTVIEAGPCVVTQIKTLEKDGYEGVQIAFGDVKENKVTKPVKGQFAKSESTPKRYIREVPVDDVAELKLGQEIRADLFEPGEHVKVTGTSKGKGFAGTVKRYHFHGADMTHGSMIHRKPQSGGATDAARTFKGVKRPGRMGNERVTQRGLIVYRVDAFRNLLLIKGSVPGANGGLLLIARQMVGG
ncbi:MAG: 50S ribosomal protein L3 [Armatimonadetes bacterium]|nr:50S ribosomal protein L3 [Armatimonadota bacterium]